MKTIGPVARLVLSAAVVGMAVLHPTFAATQALPGDPVTNFGAWQQQCNLPKAPGRQCGLVQISHQDQNQAVSAQIVMVRLDKDGLLMRIVAPLGILLPSGAGLRIDGTDIGRTGFVRCLPSGCIAEVTVQKPLRDQLIKGTDAVLTLHQTEDAGIDLSFKLAGLDKGLAALPVPPKPPEPKGGGKPKAGKR
jgi:invasion protein IalB